jgi:antitoxin HicB
MSIDIIGNAAMTEYSFTVVLEPQDEGGFLVIVPALPEVVTYGETQSEALAMAEDAIRLAVGYRRDNGEVVPTARRPQLHQVKIAVPA